MSAKTASDNSAITLVDRNSWPGWYAGLQHQAHNLHIWHLIDPDELSNDDEEERPKRPTAKGARERLLQKARIESAKAARAGTPGSQSLGSSESSAGSPPLVEPTELEIEEELIRMKRDYASELKIFNSENVVRASMMSWIKSTVDDELYLTALFKLQNTNRRGVKEIIRMLREMIAPSETNTREVELPVDTP
ncbi:hypothetical protein C7999DRAFT_30105 [Corynascus novoguineensis]|uniref:Uncharacterized protein n=1 Tax=Corynascus novoguineensis TaxID=1126955 RepID=A0AAN7CWV7_9PEZI|nr:hypothetical protein C7999DRAFT_30105 [Corynascus novoguineensis]